MKDVNTLSNSPKLTLHNSLTMRDQFFFYIYRYCSIAEGRNHRRCWINITDE